MRHSRQMQALLVFGKGILRKISSRRNSCFIIIIFRILFPIFAWQKWSGITVFIFCVEPKHEFIYLTSSYHNSAPNLKGAIDFAKPVASSVSRITPHKVASPVAGSYLAP